MAARAKRYQAGAPAGSVPKIHAGDGAKVTRAVAGSAGCAKRRRRGGSSLIVLPGRATGRAGLPTLCHMVGLAACSSALLAHPCWRHPSASTPPWPRCTPCSSFLRGRFLPAPPFEFLCCRLLAQTRPFPHPFPSPPPSSAPQARIILAPLCCILWRRPTARHWRAGEARRRPGNAFECLQQAQVPVHLSEHQAPRPPAGAPARARRKAQPARQPRQAPKTGRAYKLQFLPWLVADGLLPQGLTC